MKIEQAKQHYLSNTTVEDSIPFDIGNDAKIIMMLRERIYKYPVRTLVQEYISNARDSHRRQGCPDRPIIISLPYSAGGYSNLNISFRDFGDGLSYIRLKETFSRFGNSDNDGSDLATGGFGLGAKSAFVYADSFLISNYENGTKTTYVAHTGRSPKGTIDRISEEPTSEENGAEITIPLRQAGDVEMFVKSAYRATMFWETAPEFRRHHSHDAIFAPSPLPRPVGPSGVDENLTAFGSRELFFTEAPRFFNDFSGVGIFLNVDGIPYHVDYDFNAALTELIKITDPSVRKTQLLALKAFLASDPRVLAAPVKSSSPGIGRGHYSVVIATTSSEIRLTPSREAVIVDDKFQQMIVASAEKFAAFTEENLAYRNSQVQVLEKRGRRLEKTLPFCKAVPLEKSLSFIWSPPQTCR